MTTGIVVMAKPRIGLHSHSTASDGTSSPAELVAAGAAAGLEVLVITDHDTPSGWALAAQARPPGLTLIRGGLRGTLAGRALPVPPGGTDVFTAVRLVRAAGGVPVFAHPRATRRGVVVPDPLIVDLAAAGLFGLEADHADHSPAQRARVRELAGKLGLVVTGSSDFIR